MDWSSAIFHKIKVTFGIDQSETRLKRRTEQCNVFITELLQHNLVCCNRIINTGENRFAHTVIDLDFLN